MHMCGSAFDSTDEDQLQCRIHKRGRWAAAERCSAAWLMLNWRVLEVMDEHEWQCLGGVEESDNRSTTKAQRHATIAERGVAGGSTASKSSSSV